MVSSSFKGKSHLEEPNDLLEDNLLGDNLKLRNISILLCSLGCSSICKEPAEYFATQKDPPLLTPFSWEKGIAFFGGRGTTQAPSKELWHPD